MRPNVVGEQLHYHGVNFVVRVHRWTLRLPEWLALGHTTIVERAVDERRYAMDFRMTHPWFGQTFMYAGTFEADVDERAGAEGGVVTRAP